MKTIFYFLLLVFCISCRDNADNETVSNKELIGSWTWLKSSGGISGGTETPASTQKSVELTFTNSTLKIYENGVLMNEYSYEIQEKVSIRGGIKALLIFTPEKPAQNFTVEGNTLYLGDECYDCFNSEYERK